MKFTLAPLYTTASALSTVYRIASTTLLLYYLVRNPARNRRNRYRDHLE